MNKNLSSIVKSLTSSKKVLIIGAAIVDVIINIEKLPQSGEDIYAKSTTQTVGGCAFNVADVLSKLNLQFDTIIPVGTGPYADIIKHVLKTNNYKVDISSTKIDNGYCLSLVESDGERTFITIPGIETSIPHNTFKNHNINDYDYIYVSGYELEGSNGHTLINFLYNKSKSSKIILDLGPRAEFIDKDILNKLLTLNTILTINKSEALKLSKLEKIEDAGLYLSNLTKNPVVITLGKNGALLVENGTINIIKGFKTNVVDTIGAGDAHTGGVIAGLMSNLSFEESVFLANKISSYVVSSIGAASAPTKQQLL